MPVARLLFVLAAAGCGSADCDTPWYVDADGDGWGDRVGPISACEAPDGRVERPGDCVDGDPSIHPGRSDGCNGIDDDCDGTVDPEATEWFADADRDGFGNAGLTLRACAAPEGFVEGGGDCDDDDPRAHPGADERCNQQDDDCDTLVDEGAPGAVVWYPDTDGDGWGDERRGEALCEGPLGWTTLGGDCDDTTWVAAPGRAEVCDLLDNDCDELVDGEDDSVEGAVLAWRDEDQDGYGDPTTAPVLTCVDAADEAQNALDCDDLSYEVRPDAQEVCDGGDEDCDGLVDDEDPSVDTTNGVSGWLDADGDGLGDPAEPREGCVLGGALVLNDDDCDDTHRLTGTDWWLPDLDRDGAGAGTPVAGSDCNAPAGHVNAATVDCDDADATVAPFHIDLCGDGVDQDCTGIDRPCRAPFSAFQALDETAGSWGTAPPGFAVASAGDLAFGLHDESPDLAIFADGLLTVFWGPPPELPGPFVEATSLVVPATGAVSLLLDVDEVDELLVGSPGTSEVFAVGGLRNTLAYRVAVVGAPASGLGSALAPSGFPQGWDDQAPVLIGETRAVSLVYLSQGTVEVMLAAIGTRWTHTSDLAPTIASEGDLDGDGTPDFAVSSPTDGAGSGVVLVVSVDEPSGDLGSRSTAQLIGDAGQELGTALALGDLTGDGLEELVASAPLDDVQATNAGAVFVWSAPSGVLAGPASADLTLRGDGASARIGSSLLALDVDGDGADDLALGATDVDVVGPQSGAVFLFQGPLGVGSLVASDADWILRATPEDEVGRALGSADLDRDGAADLLVSGAEAWWWIPGI